MNLPIPIVKIIAAYTGHPWRLRVCRKWKKVADITIPSNFIINTYDHHFHSSRIIHITSPLEVYEKFCKSGCKVPRGFLIAWTIDMVMSMFVLSGKFTCLGNCLSHEDKIYHLLKEMCKIFD